MRLPSKVGLGVCSSRKSEVASGGFWAWKGAIRFEGNELGLVGYPLLFTEILVRMGRVGSDEVETMLPL